MAKGGGKGGGRSDNGGGARLRTLTQHTRPANGPGWGGPAKGAGFLKPSRPHGREGLALRSEIPSEVTAAKAERKEANREEMMGVYEEVARDPAAPHMARIVAADKWLDRTEGKPMQININQNTDLDSAQALRQAETRAQLIARLEAMARPEPLTIEGKAEE
jgi:hypothetical protein